MMLLEKVEMPGKMVYACNPSYWEGRGRTIESSRLRQEDHKFKASLGKLVRLCLKIKRAEFVVQ